MAKRVGVEFNISCDDVKCSNCGRVMKIIVMHIQPEDVKAPAVDLCATCVADALMQGKIIVARKEDTNVTQEQSTESRGTRKTTRSR